MKRRIEILSWLGNRLGKPPGFERIVRFLAPPHKCANIPQVCLSRDGCLFLTRPALPLGWHVAFFGSYEPEFREIMRSVLSVGAVAVDVGANVGWHTLLMAKLVGPGGRVVAVEPNPSVRAQLLRNVNLNRLTQVAIVACALAEAPGIVSFVAPDADDPSSASGHIVSEGNETVASIRVEASTLDALVEQKEINRVDLIKIDAEGFEWPVLQGGQQTIARFRPYIIFEFDEAYAARGPQTAALLREFFARHGYQLFSLGRNGAELIDEQAWPANANIFAAPLT
jgi:FkbM family methyltransferase